MDWISTEPISILELDLDQRADEEVLVHAWRAEQLRRLGVPAPFADAFAAEIDWRELADMLGRGCPLGLALEIVR
jgi:hypothetical protein